MSEWILLGRLALAAVLAGAIGLERELRQKQAGLRTHALVGLGSAAMVVMGAYGFHDILVRQIIQIDPLRVAAQVATGVGFIGAGVIFVQQASVRGLTTAAGIWLVAAVGMAAGAGLYIVGTGTTVLGLLVLEGFERIERLLPVSNVRRPMLRVNFEDHDETLARVLQRAHAVAPHSSDVRVLRGLTGGRAELHVLLPWTAGAKAIPEFTGIEGVAEVQLTEQRGGLEA